MDAPSNDQPPADSNPAAVAETPAVAAETPATAHNGKENDVVLNMSEPVPYQSYQMRALSRKALSLQKRQWCTNICCVALCPFLMVALCGILTLVIIALLSKQFPSELVVYCSKIEYDPTAPKIDNITHTNINNRGPCVEWFSDEYPTDPIYAPVVSPSCNIMYNPDLCPLVRSSATAPSPKDGFIGASTAEQAVMNFIKLLRYQVTVWGLYYAPDALLPFLGKKEKSNEFPLAPALPTPVMDQDGFLGLVPTDYFCLNDDVILDPTAIEFMEHPYYMKANASSPEDLDAELDRILKEATIAIGKLERPAFPEDGSEESLKYARDIYEIISKVPPSVILFEEVGEDGEYEYTLQIGSSERLLYTNANSPVPQFPPDGLRRIVQQTKLSNGIFKNQSPAFENITINQGIRMFPELVDTGINFPIGSVIGQILYPFGVSFLLPIFVLNIVKEKEERVLIMMKMNGLKTWAYFLTEFITFYTLHAISTVVFIITGVIFRLNFFTLTAPGVYLILFFIWGFVQISMAFFFAPFFSRSRFALSVILCLVILSVLVNMSTPVLFTGPRAPLGYLVYPPFAFYRALQVINEASFTAGRKSYTVGMLKPGDEVFTCIMFMIVEIFVVSILAAYLTMVFPSEYGIQRKWYFPFKSVYKFFKKKFGKPKSNIVSPDTLESDTTDDALNDDVDLEDEDVKTERQRVLNGNYNPQSPVVMKSMRKVFGNQVAVKNVTFAIDPDTVFGLLGPNGAGKTTLISILVGLYQATAGKAFLAGYELGENMDAIYRLIGVCPQHDILWSELTVEEHLLFYARLKGVELKDEKEVVQKMLRNVSLQKFANRLSIGLSGGEKRRLSIAIALIGHSKVVFLDEPTTGLDPEVRRLIWDIISNQRQGKAIILTTHSMEEAEVLCQKIGIMAKGSLRCFGSQLRLKNLYGRGFRLSVSCNPARFQDATSFIEPLLPPGWKKLDNYAGSVLYEFSMEDRSAISDLFEKIEKHKEENGIEDWGISQTSLEDVFLKLVRDADVQAD